MTTLLDASELPWTDEEFELFHSLRQYLDGYDLSTMGSMADLAEKMAGTLPDAGAAWGPVVGPVYTTASLRRWLGMSRQAINQHVKEHRILRLVTSDNRSVYPSFQFDAAGGRLPHLRDILDVLATGVDDPWAWASWLNSPDSHGDTNVQHLFNGDWQLVLDDAKETAIAWNRS